MRSTSFGQTQDTMRFANARSAPPWPKPSSSGLWSRSDRFFILTLAENEEHFQKLLFSLAIARRDLRAMARLNQNKSKRQLQPELHHAAASRTDERIAGRDVGCGAPAAEMAAVARVAAQKARIR